jgi:hypothetical protein
MDTSPGRWCVLAPEFVPSWAAQPAPPSPPSPSPPSPPSPSTPSTPPPPPPPSPPSLEPPAVPDYGDHRPPGGPGWRFRLGCQLGGRFIGGITPEGARALAADPAALRVALAFAAGTPRWRAALAAVGGVIALPAMLGGELPHFLHTAVGIGAAPAARAAATALSIAAPDPGALRAAVAVRECGACRTRSFAGGSWLSHWLVIGRTSEPITKILKKLKHQCYN